MTFLIRIFCCGPNTTRYWAIDPKGKYLLEAAVTQKLLDLGSMKNITPSIRVAFVLEGSYTVDQQGVFSTEGGAKGSLSFGS
jgi:hypothetical protein